MKKYNIIETHPVARFYYQGSHSHPIRRTILIIESDKNTIRGYEVREGKIARKLKDAPVKSYNRCKIAKYNQLGARKHRQAGPPVSTLKRSKLFDFIFSGP